MIDSAAARFFASWLVVLACFYCIGCRPQQLPSTTQAPISSDGKSGQPTHFQFRDAAKELGVSAIYHNGRESQNYAILESLGGGVGLFDYDLDGSIDVFFPGGGAFTASKTIEGRKSTFFRNQGESSGRLKGKFVEIGELARVAQAPFYSHGCAAADFDNDGFTDLLLTGYGGLQLFKNQGDGTFQEVHTSAGLLDNAWSSSAGWGDLNGDGSLDLYVAHYVNWSFEHDPICNADGGRRDVCPPRAFDGLTDIVYFSNGDGTFRDATQAAGLKPEGKGLGVLLADVDLDRDLDIYVANDTTENFLYLNDGSGRLEESALQSGVAVDQEGMPNGSMGVAIADFDGDGLPDIWVTNFEKETFALYRNEGDAQFIHASRESGVTAIGSLFVGFGTAAGDLDLDGDEDIVVANGHVIYFPSQGTDRQLPILLENLSKGEFRRALLSPDSYFSTPHLARGLALGDIDNDGDLDVVVAHTNEPAAVVLNETPRHHASSHQHADGNHWVSLQLVGTRCNRSAIGARVVLHTTRGDQTRQVSGGGSYLSQGDSRMVFGIPAGATLTGATVIWPTGPDQVPTDLQVDHMTVVVEQGLSAVRGTESAGSGKP